MIPPWSSLILCGWRSETEEEDLASGGRAAPPGPQAKELRMKGPEEAGASNPGSHHSRSFRSVPPAVEPYLGAGEA